MSAVFTPAQNAYRLYFDGAESHSTAIANDGSLRYLPCVASAAPPYASSPDSANASITGDIDLRALAVADNWNPASAMSLISKFNDNLTANISYMLYLSSGGLNLYWGDGATAFAVASTTTIPFPKGQPGWVRATMDVNDGAGNRVITFYYAPFNNSVTEPTTWIQLGTAVTQAGTTSITDNATALRVSGAANNNYYLDGRIYRALAYSGIAGTLKVDFNPHGDTTNGATSWTSATGEVWTLNATEALAAENTSATLVVNRTQDVLVRIRIQETGGKAGAATDDYQLQVNIGGAGFNNVASSAAAVIYRNSPTLTDAAATAARLSAGTGSFVAGVIAEDGLADNLQITASNYTEFLYALRIDSYYLATGTTSITFRTLINGATMTYNQTPTISAVRNTAILEPTTGAIALSGKVASLDLKHTPSVGAIALTGFAPSATVGTTVTPGAGALALTGFAPAITVSDNKSVTPGAAAIVLAGAVPRLDTGLTPSTGAIALTGKVPTVTATAHVGVTPGAGAVVLTGFAPAITVSDNVGVTPGAAAASLSGLAPTVSATAHVTLTPNVGAVTLSTNAPTVSVTAHVFLSPAPATLTLGTFTPTVAVSDHKQVTPDSGVISLTAYAPTVFASDNKEVTPGVGALSFIGYAPSLSQGQLDVSCRIRVHAAHHFGHTITTVHQFSETIRTAHDLDTDSDRAHDFDFLINGTE